MELWKNRWIWLGSSVTLCFCIQFHGIYFDYSDRWLHTLFALLLLALAFWFPKASTYVSLSWLILIALASSVLHGLSPAKRPGRGTARSHVLREFGKPYVATNSLASAAAKMDGYAIPSPLRFRGVERVDVFLVDRGALWVFYRGSRVHGTFSGRT